MRASLGTHGLGLAHIHVRLNASQLHNAARRLVGLETEPNDPANRRSYFNIINDLLGRVRPLAISFESLMEERASAKRLMMTVAQIVKFIDADTPIRFLIAETEDRLHAAGGALLRAAVRGGRSDRDFAAVRDRGGVRARRAGDRGGAEEPALSRVPGTARAAGGAIRIFRFGTIYRADGGDVSDRASAPADRATAGTSRTERPRSDPVQHAWRIDRPRRTSVDVRRSLALRGAAE